MVDAVDMLVQPFGVQCPVPPVEYKILQYKVECNLRYNNRPAENNTASIVSNIFLPVKLDLCMI